MRIGVVILAAGSGTRMGGVAKALLHSRMPRPRASAEPLQPRDERPRTFLEAILETVRETFPAEIVVVVGPPHGDAVAAHARELGARVVVNPTPERGMASSVALGFAALADGASIDAAWLWPVDHPDVSVATLRTLVAALGQHVVARPTYQGRGGHPPLVGRPLFGALAACADIEGGARTVLAASDMLDVPVEDPGCVRDIDTPADLEAR